jgi:hypothetical protein
MITSSVVESRTRWRKRAVGVQEGVEAILDALRRAVGAEALGLFDDDRVDASPRQKDARLNFWEAFGDLPCVQLDWNHWYAQLKAHKSVTTPCACGAGHRVQGFLLHDRWALLLVSPAALDEGAAATILSAMKALADKLPPAMGPSAEPVFEDDLAASDVSTLAGADAAPVWWVRKIRE